MYKELIISILIVILVFTLDYITQKYTDNAINNISNDLIMFEGKIDKDEVDAESVNKDIDELNKKWQNYQSKLSYYIEHNELEKVETALVTGQSLVKTQDYGQAISEFEKTIFILQHIDEKYSVNLRNIF